MDSLVHNGVLNHQNASGASMIQIRCNYNSSKITQATGHSVDDVNPDSAKRQKRSHSDLTQINTVSAMNASSSNARMGVVPNQNNIFNTLPDDVPNVEVDINNSHRSKASKTRCPPITVAGIGTKHLRQLLSSKEVPQEKYNMKLIKNGVQLIVADKEQFQKSVDVLKQGQIQFFTYLPPEDTPVKIILSGLALYDLEELRSELNCYGVQPVEIKVFSVKKTDVEDDVLYLLHFQKGQVKLNELKKIKALFSTMVSWRYFVKNKSDVVQCHRCQRYGHGKTNCNMLPLCVKCGERHETIQCKLPVKAKLQDKDRSDRSRIRCANCSGNHTANFRGCPVRQDYLKQLEERAARRRIYNTDKLRRRETNVSGGYRPQSTTAGSSRVNNQPNSSGYHQTRQLYADVVRNQSQPAPEFDNGDSTLFSLSEFLSLARDLFQRLRECRNKEQQFQALTELMIKYVYNV